jgi:hypothetical protein
LSFSLFFIFFIIEFKQYVIMQLMRGGRLCLGSSSGSLGSSGLCLGGGSSNSLGSRPAGSLGSGP